MQICTRNPMVGSVLREFERKLNKSAFCVFIIAKIAQICQIIVKIKPPGQNINPKGTKLKIF